MFWRPPVRSRLSHPPKWSQQAYKAAAWIYSVLALIALVIAWQVPFPERIEFDIIGFLWLITSIPAIGAWVFFIGLALSAAYCWTQALTLSPQREDPWS
jgi:hypothetical protein